MIKIPLSLARRLGAGLLWSASPGGISLTSGCAELDKGINNIGKLMGLPPMPTTPAQVRRMRMSAQQEAALGERLNVHLNDAQPIKARAEAARDINKVIRQAVCYPAAYSEANVAQGFVLTVCREVSPGLATADWATGHT